VRFAGSEARRAYLDRVIERFAYDDLERRYKELGTRIDSLFEAGESVPADLRDEHASIGKKLKG